jgi:Tol biopolymer transport system component
MSYSRRDEAVMQRIVRFLRKQGINVWVDNEKLVPGTPIWEVEIEKAIKSASAIVVLLSPDSKNSEWVRREISLADQYRTRIFPVLVRGDEDISIAIRLITRQYVDVRQNEEIGLNSLCAAISHFLSELEIQEQEERKEIEIADREKVKQPETAKTVTSKVGRPTISILLSIGIVGVVIIVLSLCGYGVTKFLPLVFGEIPAIELPAIQAATRTVTTTPTETPIINPTLTNTPPDIASSLAPASSTIGPPESATPSTEPIYRIAFVSDRDGNDEIYAMNIDGTGQINLSNNKGKDTNPRWSPDGLQIAFYTDRDGNMEVYVMQLDGAGQTNLTKNPGKDWGPIWSPDGSRIAFTSDRDGNEEIYFINADGSGLTNLSRNPARDRIPVWSPDGRKIAFVSDRAGQSDVYVMDSNGLNQSILVKDSGYVDINLNKISWSPDGSRIAFLYDSQTRWGIYVVSVDVPGIGFKLLNDTWDEYLPMWSPVSDQIVFTSYRDGKDNIYIVNADGTGLLQLIDNEPMEIMPLWTGDGNRIVYTTNRDGNYEIYIMNRDGSGQTRLTNNPANDFASACWP